MTHPLDKLINDKGWVLADGATGTNLFGRGLETGYPPELWNVERPDDVLWLHDSFLEAGSDLILTNSFGGTSFRLKLHHAQDRVAELNLAAAKLARQAADDHTAKTGRTVVVAGSLGPTGELFEPLGGLTHGDAVSSFREQADALVAGGVDMLWIETMSSNEEIAAALEAATSTGVKVASTMTFDTATRSMMGVTPAEFAGFAVQHGAALVGANCGIGPAELLHSVSGIIDEDVGVSIIAKGNCGIPAYVDGAIHYHGTPELMADYALFARDMGATVIGGCCGTSPVHVAAMSEALRAHEVRPFNPVAMAEALGTAWQDLPARPEDDNASKRQRRRRRRDS